MKTKWITWVNVALGLWLLISPFTFGYSGSKGALAAFWNSVIVGLLIGAISLSEALAKETPATSWFVSVLGIWMVFAPYLLDYVAITPVLRNSLIVGLVVAALAGYQAMQASQDLTFSRRH